MNQLQSIALLLPEIKELLREKNYSLLKQVMRECGPLDIADAWKKFDEEERLQIFKLLPIKSSLKLFEILDIEDQKYLLGRLNEESVAPILEGMHSPDLAKIFHKMSPRAVNKMKSLIRRQDAVAHLESSMTYPENTAGSLMHPEFVKLSPKLTSKQVLSRLQAIARPSQKEHLNALFVTDDGGHVIGSISLQDLVSAPEDEVISEFMSSVEQYKIRPEMDQEEVAQIFSKYQITHAPVIDSESRLIGVLMLDDILSVVRQEATEDITKMVGTTASDIRETSTLRVVANRMPWLLMTVLGGLVISLVIKYFEPTLAKIIALASFSPLIAGMGGNVGSQSATVMVRNLALGRVNGSHKMEMVTREMRVGLLLGLFYGTLLGLIAYAMYGTQYGFKFSVVVAIGMCTSMSVAATMGAVGPLLYQRAGVDPATATAPVITTITDIISNFTYFALATLLLMHL